LIESRRIGGEPGALRVSVCQRSTFIKPINWDIRREGRLWSDEEFERRIDQAPEKIEYVDGIFASDRERLVVLGMLLENLGIDRVVQFGRLEDWKAAIDDFEKKSGSKRQP
jgi:hypothetical protein